MPVTVEVRLQCVSVTSINCVLFNCIVSCGGSYTSITTPPPSLDPGYLQDPGLPQNMVSPAHSSVRADNWQQVLPRGEGGWSELRGAPVIDANVRTRC